MPLHYYTCQTFTQQLIENAMLALKDALPWDLRERLYPLHMTDGLLESAKQAPSEYCRDWPFIIDDYKAGSFWSWGQGLRMESFHFSCSNL